MATIIGEEYGEIIEGSSQKDKIYGMGGDDSIYGYGGNDNDIIVGGKGADSLIGGDGEDIFVYASGDGNDIIADYAEEDKIQITSGEVNVSLNGNNVIFTVDKGTSTEGTITVKNAKDKVVTWIDPNGVEHIYPNPVIWNKAGTKATLAEDYSNDTFNLADYGDYATTAKTIDGSATDHDIAITANKLANNIIGGAGNNTLKGGKGNDTLTGGDGADTFVFSSTDGKDIITDYADEDIIKFTSGTIESIDKSGDDVVFTFNKNNTVTVKNGANRVISYVDSAGVERTYPADVLTLNKKKNATSVTLLKEYVSEQFDVNTNAQVSDHAGTLKTINGSAVDHDIEIVGNDKANIIIGGKENNTLIGGTGNDTLTGGDGADTFVFSSTDGKDVITNYQENDVIKITAGDVANVSVKGSDVVFTFNESNTITVKDAKDKVVTYIDKDGVERTFPKTVEWNTAGTTATLLENYAANSFVFADQVDYAKTVKNADASAVDHDLVIVGNAKANNIIGSAQDDYIDGGAAKDTIQGGDGNDTIIGGKGADSLIGGEGADTFVYSSGDGNDKIIDYEEEDTIVIASGTAKFADSGKNVIMTVGTGKTTLMGAAGKYITYIENDITKYYPAQPEPPYVINGKTITLTERYKKSTFDIADYDDNLTTINASAVTHDLSITANDEANRIVGTEEDDYIDGGAGKDTILGGDGNDTLYGGAGNDSLQGGEGADVFLFTSGEGNDIITDYSEEDVIKFSGKVAAITPNKNNNNVVFKIGNNTLTVKDGKDRVITYVDSEGEHTYPKDVLIVNKAGTAVTLYDNYVSEQFDVNTNAQVADYTGIKTINGSAVEHDIEIVGNGKNNRIIGGKEDNTLSGGAGADTLVGGDGKNVFVFSSTDGKDVITNYKAEDVIKIESGTFKIEYNNDDVALTFDTNNKITVKNARETGITYEVNGNQTVWPTPWIITTDKNGVKTVTLTDRYSAKTLDVTQIDELRNINNINAAAVTGDLAITGNSKNNVIYGAAGDNTITGGMGKDVMYGRDGSNTYIYNNGDGYDRIVSFGSSDIVSITGARVDATEVIENTVIFTVGKGKISLDGAASNETEVTWYDNDGKHTEMFAPKFEPHDDLWFMEDVDNFIDDDDNQLSSLVRDGKTSYSLLQTDSLTLTPKNDSLPALTFSDKK